MSESGRDPDAERDDGETGIEADHGVEESLDSDLSTDAECEDGNENGDGEENGGEESVEVGDSRQKYVEVTERSGEHTEHVQVYLRHATDEFVVSSDDSFPAAETTRYPKADLLRVEVAQQHSTCFITTATVGESETLDVLRGFRDDVLRRTRGGETLVEVYERVSPPVARTLSRHSTARTTRLVRWLVVHSAALERRRRGARSRSYRSALALVLVAVYLVGICCAFCGHAVIGLRESFDEPMSVETNSPPNAGTRTNTKP